MFYLILDKHCNVVERLSTEELKKRLGSEHIGHILLLENALNNGYQIIEDSIEFDADKCKYIDSSLRNDYYATYDGNFYAVNRNNGHKRKIKPVGKGNYKCISINGKKINIARLLAKLFIENFNEDMIVQLKKGKRKVTVDNICCVDKHEFYKNKNAGQKKKVGIFDSNNKCIKRYDSVEEAAKGCYYHKKHMSRILNKGADERIRFL